MIKSPQSENGPLLPGWIWAIYAVLFALSIPWYWSSARPLQIWFGLPHWVGASLLATLAVALFTAFVVHRYWPDDAETASQTYDRPEGDS